jgi:predicted cupin superfamily sugar epimerase
MDADGIVDALGLVPHPEGGWYRQTWRDDAGSAIYFLLRSGEASAWHRVLGRTELWHFYAGSALELDVDSEGDGERVSTVRLGTDLAGDERPQAVVPAGSWQRARSTGAWTLVGCTVSPPFTFDAFELR